jgi:hypothetical protein
MEQTSRSDISIFENSSWSGKLSCALFDFFFFESFLFGVKASSTGSGGKMLGLDIVPLSKIQKKFLNKNDLLITLKVHNLTEARDFTNSHKMTQ